MRLKFVEPLLPTLVEKPPEGDEWIHEVKFDGYRSQIIIDHDVRIFTRNGHNWTAKYRDWPARRNGSASRTPSSTARSWCSTKLAFRTIRRCALQSPPPA